MLIHLPPHPHSPEDLGLGPITPGSTPTSPNALYPSPPTPRRLEKALPQLSQVFIFSSYLTCFLLPVVPLFPAACYSRARSKRADWAAPSAACPPPHE